jgi:RND family efflux transporter MFP subunit
MRPSAQIAAIAALLTTLAAAADGPAQAETPKLDTAQAQLLTVAREYRLDGVVEAINRTTVSAQTQGQVQEILYDVDDYVDKGAIVARLKDTEHRARVTAAAADLKTATAQLDQAKDEHERATELFAKKLIADSAMDQAVATLKTAQGGFESAQARLEQAQEQLAYTEIRAPYSGIVTHRHVQVGEIASPGQPVMTGVSLEELRVIVDVPQSVIPAVRSGSGARIYLADGTPIEAGRITVFPFADLGSNSFKVRLDLPRNVKSLFPGMFVKTGFVTGERRELAVPKTTVVFRSEVTGVYVVGEDGRIQFRQIRLGRTLDEDYTILAGLSEGERVALDPIAAGAALKAQQAAGRGTGGHNG